MKNLVSITSKQLAAAIKRCLVDEAMQAKAKELGETARARDGVSEAAEVCRSFLKDNVENGDYWKRMDAVVAAKKPSRSWFCSASNKVAPEPRPVAFK